MADFVRIVPVVRVDRCLVLEVQACVDFTELYLISPTFFRSPTWLPAHTAPQLCRRAPFKYRHSACHLVASLSERATPRAIKHLIVDIAAAHRREVMHEDCSGR